MSVCGGGGGGGGSVGRSEAGLTTPELHFLDGDNNFLVVSAFRLNGWMDDLRFYVLSNSIPVISGRCSDDNERLCAMELRLRLRRFHLE